MKLQKVKFLLIGMTVLMAITALHPNHVKAAEYEWTFSQPWVRPIADKVYESFCEKVKEYSHGRIEIKFFPGGLLGNHDESFHGVQEGSITIGSFSPYVKLVPGGVFNWIPWTISSWEEAAIAFDPQTGVLHNLMDEAYAEVGMHALFNVSQGGYGLANTVRPLVSPSDLHNLKMRVSGSLGPVMALRSMGEGTGMTLVTLPWSDIYNALSRGVVDGCWDMWASLVNERHYEVIKYYSDLNFIWDNQNVTINKDIWVSLPQELKAAVTRAAVESQAYSNELHQEAEKHFIEKLEQESEFHITHLSPSERAAFRNSSNVSAIWKELCDPWLEKKYPNQNKGAEIRAELDRIRKVAAKQ